MSVRMSSGVPTSIVSLAVGQQSGREAAPLVFSVIIPTLNEEKVIDQCLSELVRQTIPNDEFEVIVVDNGSTDRTLEIAAKFQSALRLTVVRKAKCNISAARNGAAVLAKGTFLVFLDADCVPSPEWLKRALDLLRRGDGGVIGAFYTIPEESTWVAKAWYEDLARTRQGPVSYVPSGTLFVARSVFNKIGGFDPAIQTSEDCEFCHRVAVAGYQVLSCPELSTLHLGTPQTLIAFYRKQRWHGSGIRTVFRRNMVERGFLKTIVHTVSMTFGILLSTIALPTAVLTGNLLIFALPSGLLLLGSLIMAVNGAIHRQKWRLIIPLTLLYLVYGVARSVSLLGLTGERDRHVAIAQSPATTGD